MSKVFVLFSVYLLPSCVWYMLKLYVWDWEFFSYWRNCLPFTKPLRPLTLFTRGHCWTYSEPGNFNPHPHNVFLKHIFQYYVSIYAYQVLSTLQASHFPFLTRVVHATCISHCFIWSNSAIFKFMFVSCAKQINNCMTFNRYSICLAVVQWLGKDKNQLLAVSLSKKHIVDY
jgi:hypothetical protein